MTTIAMRLDSLHAPYLFCTACDGIAARFDAGSAPLALDLLNEVAARHVCPPTAGTLVVSFTNYEAVRLECPACMSTLHEWESIHYPSVAEVAAEAERVAAPHASVCPKVAR